MSLKVLCAAALVTVAGTLITASTAQAGSQSSNTSSNSSSNNGVVRERVIDSYCANGYCQRYIQQRIYRDDRVRWRQDYRPYRYYRYDVDD